MTCATDTVVVTVNPANQVAVTVSTRSGNRGRSQPTGAFTVTRTGDTSAPLTVHYTVAGTAVAGTDYVSLPGAVTIEAGSSTAIVVGDADRRRGVREQRVGDPDAHRGCRLQPRLADRRHRHDRQR